VTEIRKPAGPADAWPELRALAVAMRPDWDPGDTEDAVRAWEAANLPYGDAARETWRAVWDPDAKPHEIRNTARARAVNAGRSGSGITLEERDELRARLLARCDAATERLHPEARNRQVS
jgi:hypothetical protein